VTGRLNWIVLGGLLACAAVIQFALLRPPFPSDSLAYFGWAESLGGNEISHGTTRLGVLVPVRIAIEVFGTSEAAYYIVPFMLSLLLIGATYVVGVRVTGSQVVGGAAGLAMVSSTLVLELNSQILPDTFAAAWFVLGMALLLSARGSAYRTFWLAAGASAIGMAYLCREYVVFMAPLVLFIGWVDHWKARDWTLLAGTLIAMLAVEMVLMAVLFGDPLARIRALLGFAERGATGESAFLAAYGEGATRWTVLQRGPGALAMFDVGKLLLVGVPAGVVLAVIDRQRRWMWSVFLIWIAALWVPMIFLAGIVDPQTPRIRDNHVRYWYLVIPVLYLLATTIVTTTISGLRSRKLAVAAAVIGVLIAAGVLVSDLGSVLPGRTFRAIGATQWDEVRDWLRANGETVDRIYTDTRMARVLPLYTREVFGAPIWQGEIVLFERGGEFLPVADIDGAILLHELGIRYLRNRNLQIPESYFDPGPGWEVAARRGDGTLTIVAPAGDRQAVAEYLTFAGRLTIDELPLGEDVLAGNDTAVESGMVLTIGPDPQILLSGALIYGSDDLLVVDIDAPESTTAQLFWRTGDDSFSEANSIRQDVAAGDDFIVFDLSMVPAGSLIRIDPSDRAGFAITDLMLVKTGE
jgi:hypothetical protein